MIVKKALALLMLLATLALTATACTPNADVTVNNPTATPETQVTEGVGAT